MLEQYKRRIDRMGGSIRGSLKQQSIEISESLFSNSTSIRDVIFNGEHCEAKIMTDSKTTVRGGNGNHLIEFRDNVNPKAGDYVQIPNKKGEYEHWLILYESDELSFQKHIIKKCNYHLRWKNRYGDITSRWVVISDNYRLTNGDSRVHYGAMNLPWNTISVILPCDKETINLRRDKRFLIDNPNVLDAPDAYIVTNRNVESKSFALDEGVIELGLSQHQFNPVTDSRDLMIADCYVDSQDSPAPPLYPNLTCKIICNGSFDLKMGVPAKTYSAKFYQSGSEVEGIETIWEVDCLEQLKDYVFYEIIDGNLKMSCKYHQNLIGSHVKIYASDSDKTCMDEKIVKVVSAV